MYILLQHKVWENDGVLVVKSESMSLFDMEGKNIGKGSAVDSSLLANDNEFAFCGKEISVSVMSCPHLTTESLLFKRFLGLWLFWTTHQEVEAFRHNFQSYTFNFFFCS